MRVPSVVGRSVTSSGHRCDALRRVGVAGFAALLREIRALGNRLESVEALLEGAARRIAPEPPGSTSIGDRHGSNGSAGSRGRLACRHIGVPPGTFARARPLPEVGGRGPRHLGVESGISATQPAGWWQRTPFFAVLLAPDRRFSPLRRASRSVRLPGVMAGSRSPSTSRFPGVAAPRRMVVRVARSSRRLSVHSCQPIQPARKQPCSAPLMAP